MTNVQVFVFGHSIVHGFYDTKGGWVQRLENHLMKDVLESSEEYYEVFNLGVPDDDSQQILKRFENEVKARLYEEADIIILFQFGINDTQHLIEEDEQRVSLEDFKENNRELIRKAKKFTDNVMFVSEAYIGIEGRIPGENKSVKDSVVENYYRARKRICENTQTRFIDLRDGFVKEEWLNLLNDGLHPNEEGHERIYELVKKELTSKGWI